MNMIRFALCVALGVLTVLPGAALSQDPRDGLVYDAATGRVHALSFGADGSPRLAEKARLEGPTHAAFAAEEARAWGGDAIAVVTLMPVPPEAGDPMPYWEMNRILRRDATTGIWGSDMLDMGHQGVPDDSRGTFAQAFAGLPAAESVPPSNCCPAWFPVADERFTEVIRLVNAGDAGAADALCSELLSAHPDSVLFHLFLIDLAIMQGRDDEARRRILAFREVAETRGGALLAQLRGKQESWLRGLDAANSGRNSATKLRAIMGPLDAGTPPSQATIDSVFASMKPGDIHVHTDRTLFLAQNTEPIFFGIQVAAKVARVRADAALFNGEPMEAISILEGYQRAGASLANTGESPLEHLIGVALSTIAGRGYEHVFLNAWGSPTEIEQAWPRLTEARDGMASQPYAEPACFQVMGKPLGLHSEEAGVRRRVAIVRWTLLRTATAARHRLLDRGDFPGSAGEFAPLLPDGPDLDPFAPEGVPLRWLPEVDGVWTAYSIGPDGADQQAAIEYDPTNGTSSPGDVSIRVRRDRQYRFPVAGEKPPRTNADFRARYGESLPPDPFADTKGLSYMIGDGESLRVVSFGPDTDERECIDWTGRREGVPLHQHPAGAGYVVRPGGGVRALLPSAMRQPIYDPTNGVMSAGDLVLVWH